MLNKIDFCWQNYECPNRRPVCIDTITIRIAFNQHLVRITDHTKLNKCLLVFFTGHDHLSMDVWFGLGYSDYLFFLFFLSLSFCCLWRLLFLNFSLYFMVPISFVKTWLSHPTPKKHTKTRNNNFTVISRKRKLIWI